MTDAAVLALIVIAGLMFGASLSFIGSRANGTPVSVDVPPSGKANLRAVSESTLKRERGRR